MYSYKLSNNKTFKIENDSDDCFNPRTHFSPMGKMICFHKRYTLGDKHSIKYEDYRSWEEMIKANTKKGDLVIPMFMYDHSGITISDKAFSCPWDSGQIGYITLSLEDLRKEYGRATKKNIAKALEYLRNEIKTYDLYLRGEVYSYSVLDENGVVEDSCGGFFGSNIKENGILDNLSDELKAEVLKEVA